MLPVQTVHIHFNFQSLYNIAAVLECYPKLVLKDLSKLPGGYPILHISMQLFLDILCELFRFCRIHHISIINFQSVSILNNPYSNIMKTFSLAFTFCIDMHSNHPHKFICFTFYNI